MESGAPQPSPITSNTKTDGRAGILNRPGYHLAVAVDKGLSAPEAFCVPGHNPVKLAQWSAESGSGAEQAQLPCPPHRGRTQSLCSSEPRLSLLATHFTVLQQ